MNELKTAKHANSLVFASPDDLAHDWKATSTDLEWISQIPGLKWFEYEKGNKVNGKQCKQRWDGQKLKNGHWIVFSECSWPHQQLVLEFIRDSLIREKIESLIWFFFHDIFDRIIFWRVYNFRNRMKFKSWF